MVARSQDSVPPDVDRIRPGEPAWRIALLFPPQGSWSEHDYLDLDTGHLVEFDSGCVEVLDMPSKEHQRIVGFLFQCVSRFVTAAGLGEVFFAPLPVRLWSEKFREPDIVVLRHGRGEYHGFPDGADLVMEVVSEGETGRRRDLETKRREYAKAGIAEYWIVDPAGESVTVLSGGDYQHEQSFSRDAVAVSHTFPGLSIPVAQILAAATGEDVRGS